MPRSIDAVMSSGWLAFASHAGFFAAAEDVGLPLEGVCGTSSGALVGALWASGMPAQEVFALVTSRRPLAWVRPHRRFWRGVFVLDAMVEELARYLPARIEDLERSFGAGVVSREGQPEVLTEGPLAEAVAASCAVPGLFAPVAVEGRRFVDGGVVDRLHVGAWQRRRPASELVVHVVESSSGAPTEAPGHTVVRSPRSGAQLWSLGDAQARFERTRRDARRTLDALGVRQER